MALVLELERSVENGYYKRVAISSGDTVTFRFYGSYKGIGWLVTPASGATVSVKFAFRPDFSLDAHFMDHAEKPSISEVTGNSERQRFSALRFTASGGSVAIEIYSEDPTNYS